MDEKLNEEALNKSLDALLDDLFAEETRLERGSGAKKELACGNIHGPSLQSDVGPKH